MQGQTTTHPIKDRRQCAVRWIDRCCWSRIKKRSHLWRALFIKDQRV